MMPATGGLEPLLGHVNGALSGRMVKTPPQAVAVGADAATIFPLLRTNLVGAHLKDEMRGTFVVVLVFVRVLSDGVVLTY